MAAQHWVARESLVSVKSAEPEICFSALFRFAAPIPHIRRKQSQFV